MKEPYLEHIFGKKYFLYKERTPRYVGGKFDVVSDQKS